MKILFTINSLAPRGGTEKVTIVKANTFAEKEGVEVAIAFNDRGVFPDTIHPLSPKVKIYDLGVTFWDLDNPLKLVTKFSSRVLATRKALLKVIKEFRPDVVITVGTFERFAVALLPDKVDNHRFIKIREYHLASDYRTYDAVTPLQKFTAPIMEWMERNIMSRFYTGNFLLTAGDYEKNFRGNPRFGYQGNPVTFPPMSVQLYEKEKIIVGIGRIVYTKNFESMLRVWAKVEPQAPGWRLRILGGDDAAAARLADYARELGCRHVETPGWCNDVNSELRRASIVCVTSRYEGFSLVIVEGMNAGVVPVSYDCPYGPGAIITDGVDGLLTPYLDEDAMAEAIVDLINDRERRERMACNAMKIASTLSPERVTDQWLEKYHNLLSQSSTPEL